jgi:amphi-Trp domain-containing protein
MSDVKVEYEQTISRDEAAAWLSQLADAFTGDHDAEFSFGPGTVKLHVPGSVRAELEVEVEIEFTWPLSQRKGELAAAVAPGAKAPNRSPQRAGSAGRSGPGGRARRKS